MGKILLTSVCRPFGGEGEGDSVGAELFHAQVTRAQGPYSLRQVIRVWGLDYIAENIKPPTVTLHYPSRREFIKELKREQYTHVGINFVVATFHKVKEMVPLIRKHLPDAMIILGGYGTVLPNSILRPYADAICREEGIGFMRRLLKEDEEAPIVTPHAPVPAIRVLSYQQKSVVGHVTAGLGCPNGCDFCCTSHFFKRRYKQFLKTGRDIYEALLATQERARADKVTMDSFVIIDEDFFMQHKRARQFLDCVREGGKPLSIFGFGSVKGLSHFTAREIAEMGFQLVWTAFEGKKAGYAKQQGVPLKKLYADLQSVGCAQLTSMIIGFPYQDEATIRAEFAELMELKPAMMQCLIYFAFPGTPFHEQVIAENRYRKQYQGDPDLRRWDGFSMHFKHPKFKDPSQIERIQRDLYQQDFQRLGPSLLRLGKVWLTGYKNLRNDPNPLLSGRAEHMRKNLKPLVALTQATRKHGPLAVREQAAALHKEIINITGISILEDQATSMAASLLYYLTKANIATQFMQQPSLLRTVHRMKGDLASQHSIHALDLQGGGNITQIGKTFKNDMADHLQRLSNRVSPRPEPFMPNEGGLITSQTCPLEQSVTP
ncbi:MAG: hypothetical protein JRF33_09760 [Deltaproteobacteria bacterium]|nr:hypothetical protein [Deltaproteobacteria bacterium]